MGFWYFWTTKFIFRETATRHWESESSCADNMANHAEAGVIDEVVRLSTKFCDGDISHILEVQSEIRRVANILGFTVGHGDGMSTVNIYDSLRRVYPTTDVGAGVIWHKTDRHRHGPDSGTATSILGTVRNVRIKTAQDHVEGKPAINCILTTNQFQIFLGKIEPQSCLFPQPLLFWEVQFRVTCQWRGRFKNWICHLPTLSWYHY